jgi:hypothetical protein
MKIKRGSEAGRLAGETGYWWYYDLKDLVFTNYILFSAFH